LLCCRRRASAKFQCVERVVTTATEKRALRQLTGADAVEMESGSSAPSAASTTSRAPRCASFPTPQNEDLPLDFNHLMDADQNLKYGKLTAALLKVAGKIGALSSYKSKPRRRRKDWRGSW